jgi:hypothetical protein
MKFSRESLEASDSDSRFVNNNNKKPNKQTKQNKKQTKTKPCPWQIMQTAGLSTYSA